MNIFSAITTPLNVAVTRIVHAALKLLPLSFRQNPPLPGLSGGYHEIWRIAYPLIIMSASNTIMQFVDRKFLASYSTAAVAAALPAGALSFVFFSFFMVTLNFTSAIVAQHFGNRDSHGCIRATWNGFYFALFAAVIVVLVMPWIGIRIIDMSGHGKEIILLERRYFIALIPSGAFICLCAPLFSYFSGQGKTWHIAVINLITCSLNVILNYLLIFGNFGFPELGITGAGIATSIASACSLIAVMSWFLGLNQWRHPTRRFRSLNLEEITRLLKFGSPSGLRCFLDVGAFTMMTFLIGRISQAAMAVNTIVLSINMLSFLPMLGLSDATSIVVGQYIGRGKPEVSFRAAFRSWHLAMIYASFMAAIFILFPTWLLNHFSPKTSGPIDFNAVVEAGHRLLPWVAAFNFFSATKFIFMGALRGAGDTWSVMFICVAFSWLIMIPGVVILIVGFGTSITAVWIFLTIYAMLECIIIFLRFKSGKWQNIKMIKRQPHPAEMVSVEPQTAPIE